jgi:hypothetical protein
VLHLVRQYLTFCNAGRIADALGMLHPDADAFGHVGSAAYRIPMALFWVRCAELTSFPYFLCVSRCALLSQCACAWCGVQRAHRDLQHTLPARDDDPSFVFPGAQGEMDAASTTCASLCVRTIECTQDD